MMDDILKLFEINNLSPAGQCGKGYICAGPLEMDVWTKENHAALSSLMEKGQQL